MPLHATTALALALDACGHTGIRRHLPCRRTQSAAPPAAHSHGHPACPCIPSHLLPSHTLPHPRLVPRPPPSRLPEFRQDFLQARGLAVPQTWEEVVELAERYNGTDLDGSGKPAWGFCMPRQPGEGC